MIDRKEAEVMKRQRLHRMWINGTRLQYRSLEETQWRDAPPPDGGRLHPKGMYNTEVDWREEVVDKPADVMGMLRMHEERWVLLRHWLEGGAIEWSHGGVEWYRPLRYEPNKEIPINIRQGLFSPEWKWRAVDE